MFDVHTHILPGVDDGSGSAAESMEMLCGLRDQGVKTVAATPHFYADRTSPEAFFQQREQAWQQLKTLMTPDLPEVRLGAEVLYFEGINHYEGLDRFCIAGTDLLLLEMPHIPWTKRMIETLEELNRRDGITVLLAHVERYQREQKKEIWEALWKTGSLMQMTTGFIVRRRTRKTALKLLRDGRIHLLGTDCHNSAARRPDMEEAIEILRRKKCGDFLEKKAQREYALLQKDIPALLGGDLP